MVHLADSSSLSLVRVFSFIRGGFIISNLSAPPDRLSFLARLTRVPRVFAIRPRPGARLFRRIVYAGRPLALFCVRLAHFISRFFVPAEKEPRLRSLSATVRKLGPPLCAGTFACTFVFVILYSRFERTLLIAANPRGSLVLCSDRSSSPCSGHSAYFYCTEANTHY